MSLIKHSSLNIAGYLIPSLVAIPIMGIMARKMGIENFGLFTLLFSLVGYASIFDVGLSRAVTRMVAIQRNNQKTIITIMGTSTLSIILLSILGMVILFGLSHKIVLWLNVSSKYYLDTILSIKIIALSIPFFLLSQIWLGFLEGIEKFFIINTQRIFTSCLISILPLAFLYIDNKLSSAIIGLVIARFLTCIVIFLITKKHIQSLFKSFNKIVLKELLTFGGWLTASNIISPIMVYFDRFILSNISGAGAVAEYTAPSDLVARLGILPGSIAKALFPKLSRGNNSYKQGLILLAVTSLVIIIPFFIFAKKILVLWLGPDYAGTPALILQILLIGFFFNSLAQAPFSAIQAKGHAKLTTYVHIIELVPYLVTLSLFINIFGVIGVAIAWSLRVMIDFFVLYFLYIRIKDK